MIKKWLILITLFLLAGNLMVLLWGDTVVLKDGSKISGEIKLESDHYKIITPKETIVVKRDEVSAIYLGFPSEENTSKESTPDDIISQIQSLLEEIKKEKDRDKKIASVDKISKLLQSLKGIYSRQKDTKGGDKK